MKLPLPLAWLLLGLTFVTAGVLRQFHDRTPESPWISPVVGSALFVAILMLLLVTALERRRGAAGGSGVRLGTVSPILLMLLIEKWVSVTFYPWVLDWLDASGLGPRLVDASFRAFAGAALILVCLLVGRLSAPTMRKTWRRGRLIRWPPAALGVVVIVFGSYLLLGTLSAGLGGELLLDWPRGGPLLAWVLGGQALIAFAEELYYRGLLMCEMERITPRLGVRSPVVRRWIALISTALLFGIEHLRLGPPWDESLRQLAFSVSLGVLFGILVMVSSNLHFVGGVHAWINWLLLGAAPHFVDAVGRPALPAGTYIAVTLILAFVLTYAFQRWRRHRSFAQPGAVLQG